MAIWLFLLVSFVNAAIKGTFRRRYITHPIQSFAIGTWIAGTSILCLVFIKQFPDYKIIISIVAILNGGLWLFYIIVCLQCYRVIMKAKYYDKVHGLLFLSTVSTQSLVILYGTLFDNRFSYETIKILIFIGIFFYMINFLFIFKRYAFTIWHVADDWKNTNCIIHGAMSITGIAGILSETISTPILFCMWLWAVVMFILVEGIEIWRAFARLTIYSPQVALGTYHVSQWARNFTFGTIFVFTLNLDLSHPIFSQYFVFRSIKKAILEFGLPVLVFFLVMEVLIFLKATIPWKEVKLLFKPILRKQVLFRIERD